MEHVSKYDLSQYYNWYSQSGTPVVQVDTEYDDKTETVTLTLTQSCGSTPGQPENKKNLLLFQLK
eukprot:UN33346